MDLRRQPRHPMNGAAQVGTRAVGAVSTVLASCVFQQRQQRYRSISCSERLSSRLRILLLPLLLALRVADQATLLRSAQKAKEPSEGPARCWVWRFP